MNNKKLGTKFENKMCRLLSEQGWWAHFIEPKQSGAQPFDIIAVRQGRAIAIDCKTCSSEKISIDRLEDNQVMAFEKWLACGNSMPYIAVEHDEEIYMIPYSNLKLNKSIKLKESEWAKWGKLPV